LTAQALVLGLQVVNSSLKRLAVRTPNRCHTGIIRSVGTCSCTDDRWGIAQFEAEGLIKYLQDNRCRCVRIIGQQLRREPSSLAEYYADEGAAWPTL
jgi:hypothetical protein